MEIHEVTIAALALIVGIGWASGISLYGLVCVLGVAGATGVLALPVELRVLQSPIVIMAAGFMYVVEFFADKTPGLDSGWDALHTFVRIPAGAFLATLVVGEASPAIEVLAAALGGTMATASHLVKTFSRLLLNASPEPFSNWGASLGEDLAVLGALWLMFAHPLVFLIVMVSFIALALWLLPKLYRALRLVFARLQRWLDGTSPPSAAKGANLAGCDSP
ncbi:MAG: DUF4126 domain-containing protein [Porticoccaceae bacterium]